MGIDSGSPDHGHEKKSEKTEVEEGYPPTKVVLPALAGGFLVTLLFALVSPG